MIFSNNSLSNSCPANSSFKDGGCYCNDNYAVQQGKCTPKYIKHTSSYGYKFCDNGYIDKGKYCEAIFVPLNALAIGGTWQCDFKFKRVGNACKEKSYAELANTIDMLSDAAAKNQCDYFESSCKSNCSTSTCRQACSVGKDTCDSTLGDACSNASSDCISQCSYLSDYSKQSDCENACSSGESNCD